jgi:hypothetical protein
MAWAMPRMPFKGVRISWLTVARNVLFAVFAASAALRASISAASFIFSRSILRIAPTTRATRPSSPRTASAALPTQM